MLQGLAGLGKLAGGIGGLANSGVNLLGKGLSGANDMATKLFTSAGGVFDPSYLAGFAKASNKAGNLSSADQREKQLMQLLGTLNAGDYNKQLPTTFSTPNGASLLGQQ